MKQLRFTPLDVCGLQIREAEDGQQSRTVVGKPIMFGVRSVNLTPWSSSRVVYEILEPGCITQDLLNREDVVYNNNHSEKISDLLGRSRHGQGTLKLTLRNDCVESACEYPNTTNANDTLEQIRVGNVFGMSFAFLDDFEDTENGVSFERTNETVDGKEVWLRHVKRIVKLYDVANVTRPAYEQTTVGTREQSDEIEKAIESQLQREQNQETEEQRIERERQEAEEAAKREQAEREARELEEMKQREEEMVAQRNRRRMRRNQNFFV